MAERFVTMTGMAFYRRFAAPLGGVCGLTVALLVAGCSVSSTAAGFPGAKQGGKLRPHARLQMVQERAEGELHLGEAPTVTRTIITRGYDLGAKSTVEVGEPIVSLRKHTSSSKVVAAVAKRDFKIRCIGTRTLSPNSDNPRGCLDIPYARLTAGAGDQLFVPGVVAGSDIGEPTYLISVNVETGVLYLLADQQGRILGDRNVAWRRGNTTIADDVGLPLVYGLLDIPSPSDEPLFEYRQTDGLREGQSYLNYDLVYKGKKRGAAGDLIELAYIEYSPFTGDVPLYTQDLVFDSSRPTISFKQFRIKVFEADDRTITFSVEDEGDYGSLS
jgi:hypothetical protein